MISLECMRFSFRILIIFPLFFTHCASRKCERFFTYKSTTIDIKGISTKLKKNGIQVRETSLGSIMINPKFVQASTELQRLDLYQRTLCEQLNAIKDDSLRNVRRGEYIDALTSMMKIAQKPDSLLGSRVEKLESAEERRKIDENYYQELKRTPPNIDAFIRIREDGEILYYIKFLNDVPVRCKDFVGRYDGKQTYGNVLRTSWPTFYPSRGLVQWTKTFVNINESQWPSEQIFKVKFNLFYVSIYADEVSTPGLSKQINKIYVIDRAKLTATEVKE